MFPAQPGPIIWRILCGTHVLCQRERGGGKQKRYGTLRAITGRPQGHLSLLGSSSSPTPSLSPWETPKRKRRCMEKRGGEKGTLVVH